MMLAGFAFAVAASIGPVKVDATLTYWPAVQKQLPGYHMVLAESCMIEIHKDGRVKFFVSVEPDACRDLLAGR